MCARSHAGRTQVSRGFCLLLMFRAIRRPRHGIEALPINRFAVDDAASVAAVLDSFECGANLGQHVRVGLRQHQILVAELVHYRLIARVGLVVGRIARRFDVAAYLSRQLLFELQ